MKTLFLIFIAAVLATSCEDKQDAVPQWPWQDPEVEQPANPEPEKPQEPQKPATLDLWTDVTASYGTLPEHIKVYKSPETLEGKKAVAYIAVADMTQAQWDIWSINDAEMAGSSDSFRTPSEVYSEGAWPIVINAGFFYASGGKNYSSSLAVRNSEVLAYNINYASEDWVTMYYPTRAALLESESGDFDACWTYRTWDNHYMYPSPAENTWESKPAKQPSATYPKDGKEFVAKTAIGGGPLLIDGGKFMDTYVEELFNGASGIGPDSNQPRTAIGVTSDKKMIIFVCEGRQMTDGVYGLTTEDIANVLLALECTEAINLDGGGSSCMLVNGKETIKVSDGSQRAVGSTIMIK
jgi:hypothetical protein